MAWALRTAGHEVRVAAPPELTATITGTGLTAVPIGVPGWDDDGDPQAAAMSCELTAAGGSEYVQNFDWRAQETWNGESLLALESISVPGFQDSMNNPPMIDSLVEFARHWRPDLIIRETFTWAGGIAARIVGAADARLVSSLDLVLQTRQEFHRHNAALSFHQRDDPTAEWLDRTLRRYGHRYDEEVLTGHWTISPTAPSTRSDVGPRTVGVRYVPFNGPAVVPDWLHGRPEHRRICVTGGLSARELGRPLFSMSDVLTAMSDLDAEVVVTVSAEEREHLGEVPANARVVDFVPFQDLLPTCSVVVHHGGGGTRATAELHGVPQVIAAFGWDTLVRAELLQELGAGLFVRMEDATPAVLRRLVDRALTEPEMASAAQRLRDELLAEPTPNDLVPLLERLTREYRTRTVGTE
ncbi:activator-dependent family glycosyltransferase [Nocardiopsis dassonvillei]|uniref:activator-dependent family glycosyltransferase n=1 Tax=Nocardiopsis dassonvillei TaxID=2014 RepID=UPI003643D5C7